MSTSQPNSLCLTPRLRPANFGEDQSESHGNPKAHEVPECKLYCSLKKQIDPSKFLALFGHLPHKLSATNYISWMFTTEATLDTINMLGYINGMIPIHKPSHVDYANWRAANTLIRSILVMNMAKEVAVQMSHLWNAAEIWNEAWHLFSGQTMTDFTLTITSLVTMNSWTERPCYPYHENERIQMWTHANESWPWRQLICMFPPYFDAPDLELCICWITPVIYPSAEVEHWIKDKHGIKTNQESVAMDYRAMQTNRKSHDHSHNGSEPHCTNYNKPGHWISGCWSKGGGAEGKVPHQKKKQQKKKNDEMERKNKKKGKDQMNEAVHNDSDDESQASNSSYMATSITSHSQFLWILNGSSTTHICKDILAFSKLAPTQGNIRSIQKKGPKLDVYGRGNIQVICSIKGHEDRIITLHDIAYCPDACDNC